MIIDSHCPAGTGEQLTGPWDTAASLDHYLRRAQVAGINHTILMPVFSLDYRRANREVAQIVARTPGGFTGFAMVHATRDAGQISSLVSEAVEQHGFRGIKVHRHDARITREVCTVARAYGVPVLYDVMGETSVVELLAIEFPDVNFIIPHLGSFSDDWRANLAMIDYLVRHPNIYTDTSGVRRFDLLVEAVRRAGPHKVLFGTDGPWLHPGLELTKVRLLRLRSDWEEAIFAGNIVRLLSKRRASVRTPAAPPQPPIRITAPEAEHMDPWRANGLTPR
jgi:predicted TIM-barrel fold metal-dependent hydrolase